MGSDLIGSIEAAKRLGVSDETVRRWCEDRKIRHIRLPGGRLRFRPEDIDEMLTPVEPIEASA